MSLHTLLSSSSFLPIILISTTCGYRTEMSMAALLPPRRSRCGGGGAAALIVFNITERWIILWAIAAYRGSGNSPFFKIAVRRGSGSNFYLADHVASRSGKNRRCLFLIKICKNWIRLGFLIFWLKVAFCFWWKCVLFRFYFDEKELAEFKPVVTGFLLAS